MMKRGTATSQCRHRSQTDGSREGRLLTLVLLALFAAGLSMEQIQARVLPKEVVESEEIQFVVGHPKRTSVKGLKDWGFYHLAIDHLQRTRENEALPEIVRVEASYFLADVYMTIGEEAAKNFDNKTKLDNYQKADEEFSRYLRDVRAYYAKNKGEIDPDVLTENLADVHYERGRMNEELGMDRGESYQYVTEEEEKTKYKADAEKYFAKATEDFDLAAKFYKARRKYWQDQVEKDSTALKAKDKYWYFRDKAAFAMSHRSWTYYHFSKIYDSEDEKKIKEQKLQVALKEFEQLAEEYSLYNIGLAGLRGTGLCYMHLGKHKEAIERFLQVMKATRSKDTVETLRLTRYNMATTYNMMGGPANAEKARVESSMLLADLERATTRMTSALRNLRLATYLEDSKALFTLAKRARQRWLAAEKQNNEQQVKLYKSECELYFYQARNQIEMVANARKSPWRRNGQKMLAELPELSKQIMGQPMKLGENVYALMSKAQKLLEEKKPLQAKRSFEKAIAVADPNLYGNSLIPECWYQVGLIYYDLPKTMPKEKKDPGHNYYFEAGSVFEHIAREYPNAENDMAKQAAYAAKEFYGAMFRQRQKAKLSAEYDAERYYRAVVLFSAIAPEHPAVRRARYEAAGIARTIGNYADAAEIYRSLKQEDYGFLEGKYLAGYCYWLAGLKAYQENVTKLGPNQPAEKYVTRDVTRARDKAIEYYNEFFKWYQEQRNLEVSPAVIWEANRWVARAKLSLAKLYIHDMSADYQQVLKLLEDFEQAHIELDGKLADRMRGEQAHEQWKQEIFPDVLFAEINAYRLQDKLDKAEERVNKIFDEFGPHKLSVRAARLLAYAYRAERDQLMKKENVDQAQVDRYTRLFSKWLGIAVKWDPSQTLDAYIDLAKELYTLKQYKEAWDWLKKGQERYETTMSQDQRLRMHVLLGQITFELGEVTEEAEWYGKAYKHYSWLLEQDKSDVKAWEKMARCYEELSTAAKNYYEYAEQAWRRVKYITENVPTDLRDDYRQLHYRSVVGLARAYCLKKEPDKERAARIVLNAVDRDPNMLRDPNVREQIKKLAEEHFPDKYDSDFQEWFSRTAQ